ncbi:MAG: UDP-2,3-diacylglucosamine diphosphatase LpxI [Nitrospirales bacterium]|nr:UDP-2,3-diacylglucosamine diphosphatase LpxI [Nitrospira sp.]MDR4502389.1 UDP-2,3-diacylglucosamine diphosphatase LpxI [Nitrospirales bacterium]
MARNERIGLIAGSGRFPIIFAENARRLGYTVSAVAHIGETAPELEQAVERIHWIKIGQLNKIINAFKKDNIHQTVMLGGVQKTHAFSTLRPDLRTLAVLARLKNWNDDGILRGIAEELESEGITILESTFGLDNILVEAGPMTRREPTKKEWQDIQFGWNVGYHIGHLDIGQCVVVKNRSVVAVEAAEGTDQAIQRGGALAQGGAVVVKRCKPTQDLRFDLPAIGPMSIQSMIHAKASVLALEARRTVILDRDLVLEQANAHRIAIVGVNGAGDRLSLE